MASFLPGCDTPPRVEVQGIHCTAIGESDPAFAQLEVDLLLENPTDEPIQLQTFEYTVVVGNSAPRARWQGSWAALQTLPALETVQMKIPAVVENPFREGFGDTTWRVSGSISYKAPGRLAQILFDTGFRLPTHDFQGRGDSIQSPTLPTESAGTDNGTNS